MLTFVRFVSPESPKNAPVIAVFVSGLTERMMGRGMFPTTKPRGKEWEEETSSGLIKGL